MRQIKMTTTITNRDSKLVDIYFNEISKYPIMSPSEEREVAKIAREQKDEHAIQKLVKANLRFAVSVAKQYQNTGLPLMDLINESNIGLTKAAHRYDETKGNKFISYAVWWCRQSILEFVNKSGRPIRLPSNRGLEVAKIQRFSDDFMKVNGREPSKAEICEKMEMEEYDYDFLMNAHSPVASLNKPFSSEDSSTLEDMLVADGYGNIEGDLIQQSRVEGVKQLLALLPPREADAIKVNLGFGETYDSVAKKHGISKERVRQLKTRAERILRSKSGIKKFMELI